MPLYWLQHARLAVRFAYPAGIYSALDILSIAGLPLILPPAEANGQADEEMVDCAPDASEQLVAEVQQHREGQDMSQAGAFSAALFVAC